MKFQDTEKAENHTKTSLSTCNKDIICDDFLLLARFSLEQTTLIFYGDNLLYPINLLCIQCMLHYQAERNKNDFSVRMN